MTPRQLTQSYFIYCAAQAHGWNCTMKQVGEEINLPYQTISHICKMKGWEERFRVTRRDDQFLQNNRSRLDAVPNWPHETFPRFEAEALE